jgi:predicted kinase
MERGQSVESVRRLRDSLGELPEAVVRPSLIMVSGLPGTGKSHFCRKLAERTPLVILESDYLRKVLFGSPCHDRVENACLFDSIHKLVTELLKKGITLALDATNLGEHHRESLYHIAEQTGAKLIVVRVCAAPGVVYQRLQGRAMGADPVDNSDAAWAVYQKMRPSAERIRRNHFKVDTSKDIAPAVEKIARIIDQ